MISLRYGWMFVLVLTFSFLTLVLNVIRLEEQTIPLEISGTEFDVVVEWDEREEDLEKEELRYMLRSIHEFAPWSKNIFVVTSTSVPDWMVEEQSKVEFVKVDDNTNGCFIESDVLGKIPRLSKSFVHMNNGMFFLNTSEVSDFLGKFGNSSIFVRKEDENKHTPALVPMIYHVDLLNAWKKTTDFQNIKKASTIKDSAYVNMHAFRQSYIDFAVKTGNAETVDSRETLEELVVSSKNYVQFKIDAEKIEPQKSKFLYIDFESVVSTNDADGKRIRVIASHLMQDTFLQIPPWEKVEEIEVDAVYTWVDGSDPVWKQKMKAFLGEKFENENQGEMRFQDHNELFYSLRSIHMFAPWVRKIFIVTDHQIPVWLNTSHPKIQMVNHEEIWEDTSLLPNFNSIAIEANLHRVPGLAKRFLYFNDDFFLGRMTDPSLWWLSNRMSRFWRDGQKITDAWAESNAAWKSAPGNSRKLFDKNYGPRKSATYYPTHAVVGYTTAILKEMRYKPEFADAFNSTIRDRFRSSEHSKTSLNYMYRRFIEEEPMFPEDQMLPLEERITKYRAIEARPRRTEYYGLGSDNAANTKKKFEGFQNRPHDFICINDNRNWNPSIVHELDPLFKKFMLHQYPTAAPWELYSP